jgi:hypothetical protein
MPPDLEPRFPGGAHQGTGDRSQENGNEEKGCEEDHQEEGCEEVTRLQDNSGRSWKGPVETPALFFCPPGIATMGPGEMPVAGCSTRTCIAGLVALALSGSTVVRAADAAESPRTAGIIGAYWGYPTKATVDFGVIATRMPANFECETNCLFHGATIQAAAGLGGGEIAIGYGSLIGETGRGTWLLRRVFVGYGVRAAVVRTWGISTLDPEGATFAGIEGAMSVAQFGMKLGLFRRLEPVAGQNDWRIFGGAGWGF